MLAKVIKVGNSKGIRIPSAVLKECNIEDDVELEVKNNTIIIYPIKKIREGWDDAFKKMNKNADESLIIDSIDAEMDEWEWL